MRATRLLACGRRHDFTSAPLGDNAEKNIDASGRDAAEDWTTTAQGGRVAAVTAQGGSLLSIYHICLIS